MSQDNNASLKLAYEQFKGCLNSRDLIERSAKFASMGAGVGAIVGKLPGALVGGLVGYSAMASSIGVKCAYQTLTEPLPGPPTIEPYMSSPALARR